MKLAGSQRVSVRHARLARSGLTSLIGTLAQRSQRHTAPESTKSLLSRHGECGMCSVSVLGFVERVGHGVVLRLQSDLHYFHGRDHSDGFGNACSETS